MSQAPGAIAPPLFCIVNGALNYSVDNGVTWVAIAPTATVHTSGPITGNGSLATPVTTTLVGVDPGTRVAVASGAIDFTGLPGTGGYYAEAQFLVPTGADNDYIIQLNGVTTGYTTSMSWVNATASAGSATGNFGAGANTGGFAFARLGNSGARDSAWLRMWVSPANGSDKCLVSGICTTGAAATGIQNGVTTVVFTGVFVSALSAPITEVKILRADGNAAGITSGFGRIQNTDFTA